MHNLRIRKANIIDKTGYSTSQNSFRILCVFFWRYLSGPQPATVKRNWSQSVWSVSEAAFKKRGCNLRNLYRPPHVGLHKPFLQKKKADCFIRVRISNA